MVILKPLLPEDIRANIQSKIEKLVVAGKGTVTATDVWGKKHLAYDIKKHEEGYYIVYKMEMPAASAAALQHELKLMSDILRSLLSKVA